MSNSPVVKYQVIGNPGASGPIGPSGNTGNTGNTGATGNTGEYGRYYQNYFISSDKILVSYSDGTTAEFVGTFRGATYADKTTGLVKGSNTGPNSNYGVLFNVSGGTFNIKGICAYGSLRASVTGPNNEYVSIDSIYWGKDLPGNFDPTTMSTGRMTYLGTPYVVYGAGLTHVTPDADQLARGISGAFNFEITSSDATSYHLNAGSKVLTVGPIKQGRIVGFTGGLDLSAGGTTLGIYLDANAAGTFVLKTPIGFRGISGNFRTNEISSVTLLIESDDVWTFPENIYFEPDENYLSCGKNIIGLVTYDGGSTWLATVAHRGHGIENITRQCIPGYLVGSCCYQNQDGTLECLDYTTRSVCDALFGSFNPAKSCEQSCGTGNGVCCANGKCIDNISVSLCDAFGGQYWQGVTCGQYGNPNGPNYAENINEGRFCYDPCAEVKSVCCKDGRCLGNYSRIQCELILGGKSLTAASCENADCCDYSSVAGACCKCNEDDTYECLGVLSVTECKQQGGVYMGPGKQCSEVSCGCLCGGSPTEDTGACCNGETCEDDVKRSECTGAFYKDRRCSTNPCGTPPSNNGICCKNGTCLTSATNKQTCEAACGNWMERITINTLTYQFGTNQNDCEFCALSRPIFKIEDVGSCHPSTSLINLENDAFDTDALGNKCCKFDLNSPNQCVDLYFNDFNNPIPWSAYTVAAGNIRAIAKELMTCPLTSNVQLAIRSLADLVIQSIKDNGVVIGGDCEFQCWQCDGSSIVCTPPTYTFLSLCSPSQRCSNGGYFGTCPINSNFCQPGPNQQFPPGGNDGNTNLPADSDCIGEYCDNPQPLLEGCLCTPSSLFTTNAVKNVKVTINNIELCIPVACGDCLDYELCEES